MKGKILGLVLGLCSLLIPQTNAAEIRYNFSKGAVYSYTYTQQDVSAISAPIITPKKTSDSKSVDFIIKAVGFQDNAFILDIGSPNATFRRYISPNGSLKGSPAEDRNRLPFFIVFPDGDWKIGTSIVQNSEVMSFGKKIPVKWTLTLTKVNTIRNLAEITFETKFGVSDDKFFSRLINYKGKIIFNTSEGVIHQAEWNSDYKAKLICKEIAISRNLWNFEKKTNYSLKMTGVEK